MNKNINQPPKTLGAAGKALWAQINEAYDMGDTSALLSELCTIADRLAEVRQSLKRDGVVLASGKANPLTNLELKLEAQYGRTWRLLGLADPDQGERRGRGRPPGK